MNKPAASVAIRTAAAAILVLALGTGPAAASRVPPPPETARDFATNEAAERFLRAATVIGVDKDAQAGRTLPWLVTLEKGGLRIKAIFKYIHRPRPHPLAHSYRYELAAYELSKILGLVIVPPTVERTIQGQRGALQIYLESCLSQRDAERAGLRPPDPRGLRDRLDAVRLFEALTGDACGNKDDTLIHKGDGTVSRIDFAEAFGTSPELSEDCSVQRCPRGLYQRMLQMEPAKTQKLLKAWLSREEVEALCARKGRILDRLAERIRERGEGAVLFPPRP